MNFVPLISIKIALEKNHFMASLNTRNNYNDQKLSQCTCGHVCVAVKIDLKSSEYIV